MELNRSLLSKVLAGYIIEIQSPDFDARMEILEDEAYAILKEREFDVDEDELLEIFSFIANMETRDIRKMKGMLKRVFSYAALLDEELTFLFAERILRIQDC